MAAIESVSWFLVLLIVALILLAVILYGRGRRP